MRFCAYIVLITVVILSSTSCGEKIVDPNETLDTSVQEINGVQWQGTPISANISWRMNRAESLPDNKIRVIGSWTITFISNSGNTHYVVHIARLVFEDSQQFQVAEYSRSSGVDEFLIDSLTSVTRQGSFDFTVSSTDEANSIQKMNVYASFTAL